MRYPFLSSVDNGWLGAALRVVMNAPTAGPRRIFRRMRWDTFYEADAWRPGGLIHGGSWDAPPAPGQAYIKGTTSAWGRTSTTRRTRRHGRVQDLDHLQPRVVRCLWATSGPVWCGLINWWRDGRRRGSAGARARVRCAAKPPPPSISSTQPRLKAPPRSWRPMLMPCVGRRSNRFGSARSMGGR